MIPLLPALPALAALACAPDPSPAPAAPAPPPEWAVALTLQIQADGPRWRASLIARPGPLRPSGRAEPDDRLPPWSPLGCDRVAALLPSAPAATCQKLQSDRALYDATLNRSRCASPPPGDLDALIAWSAAQLREIPLPGRLSIVAAPGTPAAARLADALRPLAPDLDLRPARVRAGSCASTPSLPPLHEELAQILSTQALHRPTCDAPAPATYQLTLTAAGEQVSAEITCALCPPAPPPSGDATLLIDADPALDVPLRFLRSPVRDDDLFACFADQLRSFYQPDIGTRFEAEVKFRKVE